MAIHEEVSAADRLESDRDALGEASQILTRATTDLLTARQALSAAEGQFLVAWTAYQERLGFHQTLMEELGATPDSIDSVPKTVDDRFSRFPKS